MPWKVRGRYVYKKINGWKLHARAKSPAKAKAMVRLLHMKGYGHRQRRKRSTT